MPMSSDQVKTLVDEARDLQAKAQKLQAKYREKDEEMPAEVKAELDEMYDKALDLKAKADVEVEDREREQKAQELDDWFQESAGRLPGMAGGTSPDSGAEEKSAGDDRPSVEYKSLDGEIKSFTPQGTDVFSPRREVEYTDLFRSYLRYGAGAFAGHREREQLVQMKSLSVGLDAAGGFLVLPEVFINELVQYLEDATFMRQVARVLPPVTNATSVKVSADDTGLDDAEWTTELKTAAADTIEPFEARALYPHPVKKKVLVSETLLRMGSVDAEAYVREQIGNKFAAAEENAYMNGNGRNQPLGLFQDDRVTIVRAQYADGDGGNSQTEIHYKDLVELEFAVKAQYRRGCSWIMSRNVLRALHQLTDGNGRPLLRDIPTAGARFQMMSYTINESEYAPGTIAADQDVIAFGNWGRAYWIQDSLATRIRRLDELYAEDEQIGFHATKETDGMVVDANGLAKLTMKA